MRDNGALSATRAPLSASAPPLSGHPASATTNPLLSAPILPTLVRFALPNMVAMLATALATVTETAYVGSLGTPALAGMALAFPMVMLQQMMSAGAMGGGVSSAISRALGAGDLQRANALAVHAMWIGIGAGIFFTVIFLTCGEAVYALLGGKGEALKQAIAFLGMGLSLYFSSLGAGHALGPVLAGTLRLAVVAAGGWVIAAAGSPPWSVFALVGLGMVTYGLATAAVVHFSKWGARR